MIRLQTEPIAADALVAAVRADGDGALALFLGTVRDVNAGEPVSHLVYEAYEGMAEREMRRIADEAIARFGTSRVAIVHRTGRLEIGEASVGIAVAAPHRAEALEACRFVIDAVKDSVPIWKREYVASGAVWIEGPRRVG